MPWLGAKKDPLFQDPKSRSRKGGSYKVAFSSWGPKLGDLLFRSSRGFGNVAVAVAVAMVAVAVIVVVVAATATVVLFVVLLAVVVVVVVEVV